MKLLLLSLLVLVGCSGGSFGNVPCEASGESFTNHAFGKWYYQTNSGYQYRDCERCGRKQWDNVWKS